MTDWRLECGACGLPADRQGATVCSECRKPLLVRYDLDAVDPGPVRAAWSTRRGSMWRFSEILPLLPGEKPISLGEGETPLLELPEAGDDLDGVRLMVKDEGQNPTGSFKDRGLSAAVTRAALEGAPALVVPTAGNAGAALAAYARRAGVSARLYMPKDTPPGVERRCRHYGAEIEKVDGLIDECGRLASEDSSKTGAFNVSTLREPYRIEGKKTMMLEIIEALGWKAPDAIVYPTGGGTGLIGSWKALAELRTLGLVEGSTRLYAVQSDGCAPIVRAWEEGTATATPWSNAETAAFGLRVPGALGDFLILEALRASGGGAVAVSDADMEEGAAVLGRAGVGAAIEGGATLAGARALRRQGALADGETVVLFNTAHLLTY